MFEDIEIQLIDGSACESKIRILPYNIVLRYWIIAGGTPALAYDDYSFSRRYDGEHLGNKWKLWNGAMYAHQRQEGRKIIPPPSPMDDFPKGLEVVRRFLQETWPIKQLREARYTALPYRFLRSRRLHDKEDRTYTYLKWACGGGRYVGPVTCESSVYGGRAFDDHLQSISPPEWVELAAFVDPIFDEHTEHSRLENYSEEEIARLHDLLEKTAKVSKEAR